MLMFDWRSGCRAYLTGMVSGVSILESGWVKHSDFRYYNMLDGELYASWFSFRRIFTSHEVIVCYESVPDSLPNFKIISSLMFRPGFCHTWILFSIVFNLVFCIVLWFCHFWCRYFWIKVLKVSSTMSRKHLAPAACSDPVPK